MWQCKCQWQLTTCRDGVGWLIPTSYVAEGRFLSPRLFELEALHGGILQRTAPSLIGTLCRVLDPSTSLQAGQPSSLFTWLPPRSLLPLLLLCANSAMYIPAIIPLAACSHQHPILELNARNLSGAVPWVLKCTEFEMWVKWGDFLSHHLCVSSCIPSLLWGNQVLCEFAVPSYPVPVLNAENLGCAGLCDFASHLWFSGRIPLLWGIWSPGFLCTSVS